MRNSTNIFLINLSVSNDDSFISQINKNEREEFLNELRDITINFSPL